MLSLAQPKVNEVKFFLPCLEVMKRVQTKFQVDAMRGFKVIKSRKSRNSALGQKEISTLSSRHYMYFACLSLSCFFDFVLLY